MNEKYQIILDNYINGNRKDFRSGIKKLKQVQLLEFIEFWSNFGMESLREVMGIVKRELSI